MPATIFKSSQRENILERFARLSPASERKWGKLTATEMITHCRKVNEAILAGTSSQRPTLKERSLKFLVIYLMRKMPMGINGNPAHLSSEKGIFENEYLALIQSIEELAITQNPVSGQHPVFGAMRKKEWGYFLWIHLDHHLRQFGL